ncbi:MAG: hypothetical protein LBD35_03380, partial [Prevotellaceae bacterium]|nr:hypothetical protein [Prevotellaceae bacterium]
APFALQKHRNAVKKHANFFHTISGRTAEIIPFNGFTPPPEIQGQAGGGKPRPLKILFAAICSSAGFAYFGRFVTNSA